MLSAVLDKVVEKFHGLQSLVVGARARTIFFVYLLLLLLLGINRGHKVISVLTLLDLLLNLGRYDAFEDNLQKVLPPEAWVLFKY